MAIDFSQVKEVTIPQGQVKKIQINGVTVWEEATPKVLTSITLSGQTTSLSRGAAFSFGGTVTAHYSDSSTADVTSSTTFSGYNMSTAGTYTVTASYTEDGVTKTATYTLTVNKAWSQTWSGSKTCKIASSTKTGNGVVGYTATGKGYNVQFRVTFTMAGSGGTGTTQYRVYNGSYTTTKPGSPYSLTINQGTDANEFLRIRRYSGSTQAYVYAEIARDTSNNRCSISMNGGASSGSTYTVYITITKIEQYY